MTVAVITPTISGRERFLRECMASVEAQTAGGWWHCVLEDTDRQGCAATVNRIVSGAGGAEWLLPLADDDLLLPGCIETLLAHSADADVVYSPPLVTGNEDRWWFFQAPPAIPATALIFKELWDHLGGYNAKLKREEDRDLWTRAMAENARFVRVDEPTWVYRQHAGNKSFSAGVAS